MKLTQWILAVVIMPLSAMASSEQERTLTREQAIKSSVANCERFISDQRFKDLSSIGLAVSLAPVMSTGGAVLIDSPFSFSGTTMMGMGVVQSYQAAFIVTVMLNRTDYPRLAEELASGNEGLLTQAYMDSCRSTSGPENCVRSLEILRQQARSGEFCKDLEAKHLGEEGYIFK
jgi:hypothetical protein